MMPVVKAGRGCRLQKYAEPEASLTAGTETWHLMAFQIFEQRANKQVSKNYLN